MSNIMDDINNGKYCERDEIADLQVYKMGNIEYSIPINSSPEFRRHIATAIDSYNNDADFNEVIEYKDLKDYEDSKWINNDLIINYTIAKSTDIVSNIIIELTSLLKDDNYNFSVGEIQYLASMTRLRNSFKSAIILCDRSLYIEMMPIIRLIYEQLCWCCYVIDETDIEKIKSNWTTKNTKYLKEKISENYGKVYDTLSQESHMAPNQSGKYIETSIDSIFINERSSQEAKNDIPFIISMFHIYVQVLEYGINHFNYNKEYYEEFFKFEIDLIKLWLKMHNSKELLEFAFTDMI